MIILAYIGIDPGQKGGIAILRNNAPPLVIKMPMKGKIVDSNELSKYFVDVLFDVYIDMLPSKAYIEKLWGVPGWSSTALFNYGENYGALKGILSALNIQFDTVPPKTWKKALLGSPSASKKDAIAYSKKIFPTLAEKIGNHDGIADALCIAAYGKSISSKL